MREKGLSPLEQVMAINGQEAQLRHAILAGDVAELDRLIADDLIFTGHLGQLITKEMDLDAYRSGKMQVEELEFSETDIRPMGETVLVVTRCHLVGRYDGANFAGDFRYTRLWQRQEGAWRIVAGHCSGIA